MTQRRLPRSRDVWIGRWMQLRGRLKMAWARIVGDDDLAARGNADVLAGSLQESYGQAKRQAVRDVTRGIDAVAGIAKRAARSLDG